ncbi:PREDICTED: cytoplasmic 60S subunit biogenesis factor REI1 homolog 2-like isoform X1 [Lupinus angustifolius]|uniref:cytoplasmic 60S subunit biogenesis factor REI1 homolog 2-like isoform X1 n=1 Tax=Lupinus angustifolius TaxID=3871 RepID=UPI00092E32AF|nr:PREDICTED: cytoplasmic 60S subunit biogenesis factor REI1 homolog 2-like isoform X1 [Lupinus angustifolius]
MCGLRCNACNKELNDEFEQKEHYKSEWHRYNLKRKVAGVPGVTEALYLARQSAIAQEKDKSSETPMLYSCGLCGKGYKSSKAHAEHLKSRGHMLRASEESNSDEKAIIKPIQRVLNRPPPRREMVDNSEHEEESEDDWEEVDPEEDLVNVASKSLTDLNVNEHADNADMDEDNDDSFEELDPSCCFMCDQEHKTIESCMVHMHKHHGFFIPDVEYLKDPKGLLTYLGLKVKKDYICLYCNDRCYPFSSLEAVRKHMAAKGHCKVHYGDDDDEEEVELEEFYDYSSSYVDEQGKQLVASGDAANDVELGSAGSELIITRRTDDRVSTRTFGSREFLRYYHQKPRPSPANDVAITAALASRFALFSTKYLGFLACHKVILIFISFMFRYRSMGLATVQSREQMLRMKVLKEMNKVGVEIMRSKIGMKSNVIRNLPKNCTY